MTELVINDTHHQTWGQRILAWVLNASGWFLWGYFLLPIFALGCWFLGFKQCSQWIDMSGGYPYIKEVLVTYMEAVAGMTVLWLAWVGYNLCIDRLRPMPEPQYLVDLSDVCQTFGIPENVLQEFQEIQVVVVHFDNNGHITGLDSI